MPHLDKPCQNPGTLLLIVQANSAKQLDRSLHHEPDATLNPSLSLAIIFEQVLLPRQSVCAKGIKK